MALSFAEDGHTNINHDEFLDKFIEFVEKNNWLFGGGTKQVDKDGEAVKKRNICYP
ncbi:hypothetical protein MK805_01910 [Shimazuella sp. AN120528]|uniref:hypothetical protein n=1 Tax=Shimazuella soli TaxID=1892854 RepID=UPI001F0F1CA3|nr:hypothetical protein [Shimazuella soli]MCH5583724.1 hypothetical protein [Shimazuella soli]